jgi:predicted Zn-dependent peptidase
MSLEEYSKRINALNIDDIKSAATYLKHDAYVRVVLMPESMQAEK